MILRGQRTAQKDRACGQAMDEKHIFLPTCIFFYLRKVPQVLHTERRDPARGQEQPANLCLAPSLFDPALRPRVRYQPTTVFSRKTRLWISPELNPVLDRINTCNWLIFLEFCERIR
ncbi:hypothetical protein H0G86_007053 [Trichoderma simmonsii]|uniref:Uncharacterized protein n=1 Tax=Trichoderma simmonsii TaxID=1491479 RepID=A0A8G0LHB7_9HYPO|nr:hypothetical protein H0G86_007053 [Trichoderma simmonsii]